MYELSSALIQSRKFMNCIMIFFLLLLNLIVPQQLEIKIIVIYSLLTLQIMWNNFLNYLIIFAFLGE